MHDYVIVGAGSAGCVLAARLSEDPNIRGALVEAGAADTAQEIHVPAAFGKLFQSKWDWDYLTDPEPGLDGRRNTNAPTIMIAEKAADLVRDRVLVTSTSAESTTA